MQAYGEVIDLRLASSGGCCFSATRDYSILLLRYFRSRKYNDAMPPALVLHCVFMSPAVCLTKTMGYLVQGMVFQRYFRVLSFFNCYAITRANVTGDYQRITGLIHGAIYNKSN